MDEHHWTPHQIAALTVPQMLALWGGDTANTGRHVTAAEQLEIRNRMRARRGLPPVEPRKRR